MEKLKKYRKEHGLSQADLARKLGFTQSKMSRIEGGTMTPTLTEALEFEKITKGAVKPQDWNDNGDNNL